MKFKITFLLMLFLIASSDLALASSPECPKWTKWERTLTSGRQVTLWSYDQWPSYMPEHNFTLQPQVVVLNGNDGKMPCQTQSGTTTNIGSYASAYWRQAIMIDFDYFGDGQRNTFELAAAHVVATIKDLIADGYLRNTFYLMSGSSGTAVLSAALDFHPDFVDHVERAIFVSGPFTDIYRMFVYNTAVQNLMDENNITHIKSLDYNLSYIPDRSNQWFTPLMNRDGLRFVVAEDDYIFCHPDDCYITGTLYEEFLKWVKHATNDHHTQSSLENAGYLQVYPTGGHDLFETRTELFHFAFGS